MSGLAYSLPLLLPGRRRFLAPSTPCGWKSVFQMRWGGGMLSGAVGSVVTLPDPRDVRFGVVYDFGNLPVPRDVRLGVVYG